MAVPIASLPVAMIDIAAIVVATIVVAAVIMTTLVVTPVVTIVATLITVAVAIVGLRSSDGADERDSQSSSSDQTFHFDLPDSPANRLGTHYRPRRLIGD